MKLILPLLLLLSSCGYTAIDALENRPSNIYLTTKYKNLKLTQKQILREIAYHFPANKEDSPLTLEIKNIQEHDNSINTNTEGLETEFNYRISLTAIVKNKNNKKILEKTFSKSSNYRINSNYYASNSARENIRLTLAKSIAQDIHLETILNLKN